MAALWHKRYGHLNFQGLQLLHEHNLVLGLPNVKKMQKCEECALRKRIRLPFQDGRSWKAKHKLHLVHANVCGPMQTKSNGGSEYFLLFVDDF